MAISFFYAVGTAIGGITGPLLFGKLIESGESSVMYGYLLGAALMFGAGIVEIFLGVEAAQKQLEDIAKPLTAEDAEAREAKGEDVVTDDDLDTVATADWVIDLGPGGGDRGGEVVAAGRPAEVAAAPGSVTAPYLAARLDGAP
jgi:hypothetical protein